ncbi:MAG: DUF3006 domain-containing protein [Chloroflexi bacterium]|nr:DUF3006 domain-containing protein [Chloroflexota bacterium]MCL5076120.1 DUF3006 domain-containing protein [Chloroflexota bacterium]
MSKSIGGLRGVIDRFEEGKWAVIVLDDEQQLIWPVSQLPPGAKEGSAIVLRITVDDEDTKRRRGRTEELLKDIFTES